MTSDIEELISIYEIGEIMAKSIISFFSDKSNQKIIKDCLNSGIRFAEVEQIEESKFSGEIFVFTGNLEKFSRKEAQSIIEKLGARVSGSVSSKTDYLVAGSRAGFKLEKAEKEIKDLKNK